MFEKLLADAPGIIERAVQGLRDLRAGNRTVHLIRTADHPSDPLFTQFVRTRCELDKHAWTPADDFYAAFRQFQATRPGKPDSRELFGRRIARAKTGIRKRRRRQQGRLVYGYQGVRLLFPAGQNSTLACEHARNGEQVCAISESG